MKEKCSIKSSMSSRNGWSKVSKLGEKKWKRQGGKES